MSSLSQFFMGNPGKFDQRSILGQSQQPGYNQLQAAAQGGQGGAFGQAADYYRGLLSDNPASLQAQFAPEMRQFQQQTLPTIASQFASIGSGALNSSGYRNATLQAGTDLTERLAALRANLQQQGAQGLMGIGQQGLGQYFANTYQPRTPGFLEGIAPGIGAGLGAAGGGAAGGLSSILPFLAKMFSGGGSGLQSGVQ